MHEVTRTGAADRQPVVLGSLRNNLTIRAIGLTGFVSDALACLTVRTRHGHITSIGAVVNVVVNLPLRHDRCPPVVACASQ